VDNVKVGIREVARQAGVSVATVSRVLNDKPDVSPDTRARILRVLEEVGFQLNRTAVSLSTGRTGLIALVLGEFTAFSETVEIGRAVATHATERNYGTVLWLSGLDEAREARYADLLAHGSVDGAILAAVHEELPMLERLGGNRLPVVLIEPKEQDSGLPTVRTDHRRAGELAVEHLASLGHERIGIITLSEEWTMGARHLEGYRSGIERSNLTWDPALVATHLWWDEMGYDAGHRWGDHLLSLPDAPTAIVCCADNVAVGVMDVARGRGLEIPEDLSVTGFDDIPGLASMPPGLTTIRKRASALGQTAAELLFRVVEGDEGVSTEVSIPTELEVRGSTGRRT
jgi:LacI family transcriptional regulator